MQKRQKQRERRKENWKNTPQEVKEELKKQWNGHNWKKKQLSEIEFFFPHIVIDFGFAPKQEEKELTSVINQVNHGYGFHRKAMKPLHLHFTSFSGKLQEMGAKIAGFDTWKVISIVW
jgi:Trm5-related predicted tRNA methylase